MSALAESRTFTGSLKEMIVKSSIKFTGFCKILKFHCN